MIISFGILILLLCARLSYCSVSIIARDEVLESGIKMKIITCEVNSDEDSELKLYCPVLGSHFSCYQECTSLCSHAVNECSTDKKELLHRIQCKSFSRRKIEYKFSLTNESYNGEWYCGYRNLKSAKLRFTASKIKITTLSSTTRKPTTTPYFHVVTRDNPIYIPDTNPNSNENKGPPPDSDWATPKQETAYDWLVRRLSRTDLVIIILSLLAVSLLVNVVFCIRCILIRRYLDLQKTRESVNCCLEKCLCMGSQLNLESSMRKADGMSNTFPRGENQMIYEDPSSIGTNMTRAQSSIRTSQIELSHMGTLPHNMPISMSGNGMQRSSTFPVAPLLAGPRPALQDGQDSETVFIPAIFHYPHGSTPDGVASSIYAVPNRSRSGSTTNMQIQITPSGSQFLYDEVPLDQYYGHLQNQSAAIKQAVSTGSLYRGKRLFSPTIDSPLPEESTQLVSSPMPYPPDGHSSNNDRGSDRESLSSVQTGGSSVRSNSTRLELSKKMLEKADTLLREAGTLLKENE